MEPGSWTRRIAFVVLVVVAIAGVAPVMLYCARGHNFACAAVPARLSSAETSHSEPQTEKIPVQQSTASPDDPSVFASIAEDEVTQLREGFTLAQWVKLHGEREGWERKPDKTLDMTDWPRKECLSYVKRERLPSGAELVRALYFYPPPVPSPVTFPTLSSPESISGCVLAIVLVEATSRSSDFDPERVGEERAAQFAHPLDQAVRQRFAKLYGEGVGMKN